jgi:hypothetical protein
MTTNSSPKIKRKELQNLLKKKKSRKEIAAHFGVSINAVDGTIRRYGLKHISAKSIKKARKTRIQTRIFNEVNLHATTAQGMINELSTAISDNVFIKEAIKNILQNSKKGILKPEHVKRFFDAQDKVVQRMEDYRNLQKDLIGILELQKFVDAIIEAYKTLPHEHRVKFQDELKKRNIIHLSIEQVVRGGSAIDEQSSTGRDDTGRNRDISARAGVDQPASASHQ